MEKTKLIVEYLVAGTLIMVSMLILYWSYVGIDFTKFSNYINGLKFPFKISVIVSTIFIAAAYALGIVAEFLGEKCFEWRLNQIKKKRVIEFIEENDSFIRNDPIFKNFQLKDKKKWNCDKLKGCIGKMRFCVMSKNSLLYADISAQINRLRLIRVLFIVEMILLFAVLKKLYLQPKIYLIFITLTIFAITVINIFAIFSRFGRYCRSVERSFLHK